MNFETIMWFTITFILFLGFTGWVIHEIRSVDHRHLSQDDAFRSVDEEH